MIRQRLAVSANNLPMIHYQAVIFDMDGVLVHSEPLHRQAYEKLFAELGRADDHGVVYAEYYGRTDQSLLADFIARSGQSHDLDELLRRKQALFLQYLRARRPVFDELNTLLPELAQRCPLAVASSSPHKVIDAVMEITGLRPHFKTVVGFEDFKNAKPNPEIFLTAAKRLGVEPSKCIVVEDAVAGVRAAKAAGMTAIGFTSSLSAETLKQANADFVAENYDQISRLLLG
jgi:beta-phosphoglucomutase family hydrolase